MNVLHINVNFNKSFFPELLNNIGNLGAHQIIYYPCRNNVPLNDKVNIVNSSVIQDHCLNIFTRIFFVFKAFLIYDRIKHKIDLAYIDLIHAHTLFSDGAAAYLLNRKYRIPYVISVRNTDLNIFLKYKPWLRIAGNMILKNAEQIICISEVLRKVTLIKFAGINGLDHKIHVIPNGIRNEFLDKRVISSSKQLHQPVKFIFVGSFWRLKNVERVIRFLMKNNHYSLEIVGSGGTRAKHVMRLINKHQIKYYGQVNDPDSLIDIFRQNDIFIMPSSIETFGIVYIEAISQGLPVIYSKNTGIDGLFEEGVIGFPVNWANTDQWETVISKLIDSYEEISRNCIVKAREFNWNSISKKYVDVYELSIIKKKIN